MSHRKVQEKQQEILVTIEDMNNSTVHYIQVIQVKENLIFSISRLHSLTFQNPFDYKRIILMNLSYYSTKWKVNKKRKLQNTNLIKSNRKSRVLVIEKTLRNTNPIK